MDRLIPALILSLFSIGINLISDIHLFQQFGYYTGPTITHKNKNRFFADHIIFYISIVLIACAKINVVSYLILPIIHIYFQILIVKSGNKKTPLVYTNRVKRLIFTSFLILSAGTIVIYLFSDITIMAVYLLLVFVFSDFLIFLANLINQPYELLVNNYYYSQAKKALGQAPFLKSIGITGSYGKTSTKSILGEILKTQLNTVVPISSYNTKLGLTRTIRAEIVPTTEVFIAEMGAKKLGEIKEIAEFIRPDIAVITSIGEQHLETFKNLDNIIKEKSEIFKNLKEGGLAIINKDFKEISTLSLRPDIKKITYSVDTEADFYADNIRFIQGGYSFEFIDNRDWKNPLKYPVHSKLLGRHNISNIMASAVIAIEMGISPKNIIQSIAQIEPVKNRLSLRKENGTTILEDAFSSNPIGAKAALDVLSEMSANKRIIITPGMIELAEKEKEVHHNFGCQISKICDEVILVGKNQTRNILKGLQDSGYSMKKVHNVPSMAEAFLLKDKIAEIGDVVLIENDLPEALEN